MKHQKLIRSKNDTHKQHFNFEWSEKVNGDEHSSYNWDNEKRFRYLLSSRNYTLVDFLMMNNDLLFVVRDLLSLDKSNFVLKSRSKSTHLNRDSRHMTTDTTTILGFLTLGTFKFETIT